MKLNELRSKAGEKLKEGKRAKDELDHNRHSLEQAARSREEHYDLMAKAMEVDEDFRPKGDIVSANEAFERAKAEERSFGEKVEKSSETLEEINAQKRETIDDLETYIEDNVRYMDSLSGAKDNRFGHTFAPLEETFAEHIAEAEDLRDELLNSLEEGTGPKSSAGDTYGAGAGDMQGAGPETGADMLSDEEDAWRSRLQQQRSMAFREKVMSDPMTKNALFSGVRAPAGAGGSCLTFGINDENLSNLSYAQGNNTLGWGNDCSLAQIANIMTLAGIPTAEEQVVGHVNAIRASLRGNPVSSKDSF
ncbi:MAG: hypothetical protein IJI24_09060 [Lachnospiraceae bacterium]|nr:hypothetical protein [Lachnospiraceae bacterium]